MKLITSPIKSALRQFDKWRRQQMNQLESPLYALLNHKAYQTDLLPKQEIKTILVVRNNKRIGNMYFLIPFIRQLRALYPDAQISLLLNQPWQEHVFENMGVDSFSFSRFSFKHLIYFLRTVFYLRKQVFDMIICPHSSVEDSLITAMLTGRNKIAPDHELRNPVFTQTFKPSHRQPHMALSNLFLLSALGHQLIEPISHHLVFTQEEEILGRHVLKNLSYGHQNQRIMAYFRGARGKKKLSQSEWLTILQQFENSSPVPIYWIEILSPDITKPLTPETPTFANKNMRLLASFLKNVDGFICCDTGPLHLADAAGACCFGLYNHTDPRIYGVLGSTSINMTDIHAFTMEKSLIYTPKTALHSVSR